jgi:hypothetical protein
MRSRHLCRPDGRRSSVSFRDEQVEFVSAITAVDTMSYGGHAGVRRFLANLAETFEWLEVVPVEVMADRDRRCRPRRPNRRPPPAGS